MQTKNLTVTETVFDGVYEKSIECDFFIPDYYPDVFKLVRTDATVRVTDKSIVKDKLLLEGFVDFTVMYLPQDSRTIRSITYPCQFAHSFDMKDEIIGGSTKVKVRAESAVCKVLSTRKIAPKVTLGIAAKVYCSKEISVLQNEGIGGIEVQTKNVSIAKRLTASEKRLELSDDFVINDSLEPIGSIIKNETGVSLTDIRILSEKAIVRGCVQVKTLYTQPDDDRLQSVTNELLFSQIIDIEELAEEDILDLSYDISDCSVIAKDNAVSQTRLLAIDLICMPCVRAYKNIKEDIVVDAYSLQNVCTLDSKKITFESIADFIKDENSGRSTLELEFDIKEILSLSLTVNPQQAELESNSLNIIGNLTVNLIAADMDDDIISVTRMLPIRYGSELSEIYEKMRFEPEMQIKSFNYNIASQNSIEIRYDLKVCTIVYGSKMLDTVFGINVDEETAMKSSEASVVLYFAKEGEQLWDIAKQYCSAVELIKTSNSIKTDSLEEDKMLIIPKKVS